jgi:hypothetical protein
MLPGLPLTRNRGNGLGVMARTFLNGVMTQEAFLCPILLYNTRVIMHPFVFGIKQFCNNLDALHWWGNFHFSS